MNLSKAEKLFILMKKHGVSHFKTLELEIKMADNQALEPLPVKKEHISQSIPESQAIPPVEVAIPHHVNEVSNLLKLNDNDLVDKIFPDFSQINAKDGE